MDGVPPVPFGKVDHNVRSVFRLGEGSAAGGPFYVLVLCADLRDAAQVDEAGDRYEYDPFNDAECKVTDCTFAPSGGGGAVIKSVMTLDAKISPLTT